VAHEQDLMHIQYGADTGDFPKGWGTGLISMPKAVLFDMDGVLVDSTAIHADAFQRVLQSVGIQGFVYAPYAGMRTADVIREVLVCHGLEPDPEQIAHLAGAKSSLAAAKLEAENPLFPYVLEVLERLSARFALALVSSGSEWSVRRFLERNRLEGFFRAVVHAGDVARTKPAPDAYLEAARRLNLPPSECLVLEDADAGEEAARAAGCSVWRVGPALAIWELPPRLGLGDRSVAAAPGDSPPYDRSNWTAVIPAAGRGTRLGSDRPKVLFEIAERRIIDWLLDLLLPRCANVIVVAAPGSVAAIGEATAAWLPRVQMTTQPEPIGMADAVERGLGGVSTDNALVIWGDQAAVRPQSLDLAMRLHMESCALATVPTIQRERPYIHFVRGPDGRILNVLQAREGDAMPPSGESDAGVFLFRTRAAVRALAAMRTAGDGMGRVTKEWNLLPILSRLDTLPGNVLSAPIMTEEESVGVNTPDDARFLASVLSTRRLA
jgi:HAD superfamily hydrolase (TIGR01509 family)